MNAPPQPLFFWTEAVDDRVTYTVVLIIVLAMAVRLGEWMAQRAVADEYWCYAIQKLIRYSIASLFLFTALGISAQRLQCLLIVLGATRAGLAIALAPVIVSMARWTLIISSKQYKSRLCAARRSHRCREGYADHQDVAAEIGNWV